MQNEPGVAEWLSTALSHCYMAVEWSSASDRAFMEQGMKRRLPLRAAVTASSALFLLWGGCAAWLLWERPRDWWWVMAAALLAGMGLAVVALRGVSRFAIACRETEERMRLFQKAVEDSSDGMAIRDAAFRPVYANRAHARILGVDNQEFMAHGLLRACSPATASFLRDVIFATLEREGQWRGEVVFERRDGSSVTLWAAVDSLHDAEGRVTHYVGVFHDVTEHQRARDALRRSETRLRMVLDATSDGVFDHDLETGETYFSDSYYRLLGFEPGQVDAAQVFWGSLIHFEDKAQVLEALRDHLEGRVPAYRAEFRIRDSRGRWRWVLSRGSVMERDSDGRPLRIVGTHSDITEIKLAQMALESIQEDLERRVSERTSELREANARIRTLTRQMLEVQESERRRIARDLHDNVAQNLTSLKILLETLLAGPRLVSPEARERASLISRTLQDTVGAVREIAYDLRPPSLDQLGMVRAVAQYCEDFSGVTGVAVDFSSAGMENMELESGVEVNLFRIIQEGLTNVGKHSGAASARVRIVSSHPHILLRVEDDGVGFDPETVLAAAEGENRMGLRGMAERAHILGGRLRILSSPGKGARLVVEIPCARRADGDTEEDSHR